MLWRSSSWLFAEACFYWGLRFIWWPDIVTSKLFEGFGDENFPEIAGLMRSRRVAVTAPPVSPTRDFLWRLRPFCRLSPNWIIKMLFSLNISSLFLSRLCIYLSVNPLFCRFRVFSIWFTRGVEWMSSVCKCVLWQRDFRNYILLECIMAKFQVSCFTLSKFISEKMPSRRVFWGLKRLQRIIMIQSRKPGYGGNLWAESWWNCWRSFPKYFSSNIQLTAV